MSIGAIVFWLLTVLGVILGFVVSTIGMCKYGWYKHPDVNMVNMEEYVLASTLFMMLGGIWWVMAPFAAVGGVIYGLCHLVWEACPNK